MEIRLTDEECQMIKDLINHAWKTGIVQSEKSAEILVSLREKVTKIIGGPRAS